MTFFDFHTPEGEQWRPHPDAPFSEKYLVSNIGRIKSLCRRNYGRFLKQGKNGAGYPLICLPKKTFSVHRLVARAFLGGIPEGMEVNHKNGVKFDNRVENLEYLTKSENVKHGHRTGLIKAYRGESNKSSKLTEKDVTQIRKLRKEGVQLKVLASKFGVALSLIGHICTRRCWKHIA